VPTKQLVVGGEGRAQTTRRSPAAAAGSRSISIRLTRAMWTASDAPKPAAELPRPTNNPPVGATTAEIAPTSAAAVFTARGPRGVAASPAAAKELAEPVGATVRAVFVAGPEPSPRGRSPSSVAVSSAVVSSKRPRAQVRGGRSRPRSASAARVRPVRRESPGASVFARAEARIECSVRSRLQGARVCPGSSRAGGRSVASRGGGRSRAVPRWARRSASGPRGFPTVEEVGRPRARSRRRPRDLRRQGHRTPVGQSGRSRMAYDRGDGGDDGVDGGGDGARGRGDVGGCRETSDAVAHGGRDGAHGVPRRRRDGVRRCERGR
jgi:hypothetical protein